MLAWDTRGNGWYILLTSLENRNMPGLLASKVGLSISPQHFKCGMLLDKSKNRLTQMLYVPRAVIGY